MKSAPMLIHAAVPEPAGIRFVLIVGSTVRADGQLLLLTVVTQVVYPFVLLTSLLRRPKQRTKNKHLYKTLIRNIGVRFPRTIPSVCKMPAQLLSEKKGRQIKNERISRSAVSTCNQTQHQTEGEFKRPLDSGHECVRQFSGR